jgi:hypothetical protein
MMIRRRSLLALAAAAPSFLAPKVARPWAIFAPSAGGGDAVWGQAVEISQGGVLYRSAALVGVSDSPEGTLSLWHKQTNIADNILLSFCNGLQGGGLPDNATKASVWHEDGDNPGGPYFNLLSSASYVSPKFVAYVNQIDTSTSAWRHLYMTWKTDHIGSLCVSGFAVDGVVYIRSAPQHLDLGAGFSINCGATGVVISGAGFNSGGTATGTALDMSLAEFYLNTTTYLEPAANIAKFRNPSTGKPVNLGVDGSVPTGTAPAVYLKVYLGEVADDFLTNRAAGGNFTSHHPNGALRLVPGPY